MSTTSCERCEDFAADALKVLSQRCAPDERHCSCVPHLRAEIDRLTAERAALLAPVDGINEDLGVLANMACEDPKHDDLWCPTCEEYPTIRTLAHEAIRLRAELEEARLTLAAEQGRAEGAPSEGWVHYDDPTYGQIWEKRYDNGDIVRVGLNGIVHREMCRRQLAFRYSTSRAAMLAADASK